MVHFNLNTIVPGQISEKKRALLNSYHAQKKKAPYLSAEEAAWLKDATGAI